jgi:hypothetical protein
LALWFEADIEQRQSKAKQKKKKKKKKMKKQRGWEPLVTVISVMNLDCLPMMTPRIRAKPRVRRSAMRGHGHVKAAIIQFSIAQEAT